MTIFLRFPDEPTFLALLPEGVEARREITLPAGALSVVGTIYKPTGEVVESMYGGQEPVMAATPGWHVNAIGTIPEGMLAYQIPAPTNPMRTF